jgi:hypothetical protein
MALPSFIDNATSLDDGMANSLAGGLSKLRTAQAEMNNQLVGVKDALAPVAGGQLPLLPDEQDIFGKAQDINNAVNTRLTDLHELNNLTGGCLDTALGAATDIARDGLGFIADLLDDFQTVDNMPKEMFDIYALYGKAQEFANSLGIDQLVADMNGLLTCGSASGFVGDVTGEIENIMGSMGLDTDGKPDPTSYYDKMKAELGTYAGELGIDPNFTDSMSAGLRDLTTYTNDMATQTKNAAAAQIKSLKAKIKSEIPPTPTPPSFF